MKYVRSSNHKSVNTFTKLAIPETVASARKAPAHGCVSPITWSNGFVKTRRTCPKKMANAGKTAPWTAAPSTPRKITKTRPLSFRMSRITLSQDTSLSLSIVCSSSDATPTSALGMYISTCSGEVYSTTPPLLILVGIRSSSPKVGEILGYISLVVFSCSSLGTKVSYCIDSESGAICPYKVKSRQYQVQ